MVATVAHLTLLLLSANADFKRIQEVDGIVMESRPVPGSSYAEFQLSMVVQGDPQRLCRAAFGTGKVEPWETNIHKREVIHETTEERTTYEQVAHPLVKWRDYAVHRTLRVGEDGSCRIDFELANALAPPTPKGFLRIQKLSGHFLFEKTQDGKVHVVHRIFTDPGGSLPAFLAEPSRKDAALAWMRHLAHQN